MKKLLCALVLTYVSFSCLAQTNPDHYSEGPSYAPNTNDIALVEAGQHLQTYSRHYYTGAAIMGGGYFISMISATSEKPNEGMILMGGIFVVSGMVIQFISHKYIGKAGRALEKGSLASSLKVTGSSTGIGLGLAYHF